MSLLNWRKSTFSENQANCVELATTHAHIHIRESDDPGTAIHTTPATLRRFIRAVKTGGLDHTI
jgi:hypothetical protein